MKQKDITELKSKTAAEIDKAVFDLRLQITKAKMELSVRKAKNVNLIKNLKKNLAQLLTAKKEHANS